MGKKRKAKGDEEYVCYYCGRRADTVDHVIPQSILRQLALLNDEIITKEVIQSRILQVHSCRQCNSYAGKSLQNNLHERKQFIKSKIRKRYKKVLSMPIWSEEEVEELGYGLRSYIEQSIKLQKLTKERLNW